MRCGIAFMGVGMIDAFGRLAGGLYLAACFCALAWGFAEWGTPFASGVILASLFWAGAYDGLVKKP